MEKLTKLEYKKLPADALENKGDILCYQYTHTVFPDGVEAIHMDELEEVDGKPWEVFHVSHETTDGYYGMPMLGLGMINCYIRKADTRPFSEREIARLNMMAIGLVGSHTGKDSGRRYSVNITPLVDKFNKKEK